MDRPLDIITLTFNRQQWRETLEAAQSSEWGSLPTEVEAMIISALCPDGHSEMITPYKHTMSGYGNYIEYNANCLNCGINLWRITPVFENWKPSGKYKFISWQGEAHQPIVFTPDDENDPKKVEL